MMFAFVDVCGFTRLPACCTDAAWVVFEAYLV